MKNSSLIACCVKNSIVVICFTALAVYFNHWWIALFASFLLTSYESKRFPSRICDGCGKTFARIASIGCERDEIGVDKKVTNGDMIRAMSDEELADFLTEEQYRLAKVVFDAIGWGLEKQVVYAKRLAWLNAVPVFISAAEGNRGLEDEPNG